jgi:hypothetical protein
MSSGMLSPPPCKLGCSLSVFFKNSDHEYRESLPILSAGAAFTLVIPSAFVSFPSAALDALTPHARSRIISAGPFHNLVFWSVLVLVQRIGVGDAFWAIGYKDMSAVGRVVIGVDAVCISYPPLPESRCIQIILEFTASCPLARWVCDHHAGRHAAGIGERIAGYLDILSHVSAT